MFLAFAVIFILQIQQKLLFDRKRKHVEKKITTCVVAKLPKEKWCKACVRKRSANMCVRRKIKETGTPPMPKRQTIEREFYAKYASPDEIDKLDEDLENDMSLLYPWCPSVAKGGTRRSARLLWKEAQQGTLQKTREKM